MRLAHSARISASILAVCATGLLMLSFTQVARAGDDYNDWECDELWESRNQTFKDGGYCFTSPRAIKKFGNAGCLYDDEADVPLSDNQRSEIKLIRAAEKHNGC